MDSDADGGNFVKMPDESAKTSFDAINIYCRILFQECEKSIETGDENYAEGASLDQTTHCILYRRACGAMKAGAFRFRTGPDPAQGRPTPDLRGKSRRQRQRLRSVTATQKTALGPHLHCPRLPRFESESGLASRCVLRALDRTSSLTLGGISRA